MKQLIFIFSLVLFGSALYAQKGRAYWKNDTILIGEPAELVVEFENISGNLRSPKISTTCGWRHTGENLFKQNGEVEILSTERQNDKKNRSVTLHYQLTAWDSAIYQLPELEAIVFNSSTGKRDTTFQVKAPELVVVFEKKKIDDSITEVEVTPVFNLWGWIKKYGWIVALGLAIPLIIFFWNKRRKHQFSNSESMKAKALRKLNELRKKEYWKKGKVEQHYVAFTHLLRVFLSVRYNHSFLEKTSFECRVALRTFGANELLIERVGELLYEADLAKFGKTIPTEETTLLSLNKLEEIIIELSPLDIPT